MFGKSIYKLEYAWSGEDAPHSDYYGRRRDALAGFEALKLRQPASLRLTRCDIQGRDGRFVYAATIAVYSTL